ncbi:MAG: hypothetical protein HS126_20245 [Anaerolineales bacterium]|nr:hypothetical protein [Anaerolineales bacterium]
MEIEIARSATALWQETKIQNLKSRLQNPAWAVWVGAFVLTTYLGLLPFVERTWRATGDEPHYLLTTHSLVHDGDFDLANNYAQLDYLNFYFSKDITPQIRLGPSGQQILDHQLALPVLVAPAYALAGREGVLLFQVLLGALLAALTFKLAWLVSQDEFASLLATLFVALSPPLLMYNYLVYPEMLGAVLTTLVLYYAVSQNRATPASFVLILFSLITLPWLNRRFVPLAMLLALLIVWAWRGELRGWKARRLEGGATLFFPAATVLSIGLLLWFNSQLIEVGQADITAPTITSLFWDRVGRGLVGWLVDQQRGMFIFAPIYIFAGWGLPFLLKDHLRQRHWWVILPFLLSLGVTAVAGGFWIAWELGPRFLVVALPGLAPLLALAWRIYSRHKVWRGLALLLFGLSLSNTLVILQNPELPYKSSLPLYYAEKFGLPLTEWLPDLAAYERIGPATEAISTEAQIVDESGEMAWLAQPGSPVSLVRSGPLPDLSFGHYHLTWQLRTDPGVAPDTELVRLSLKTSGGGQIFNKIITAADLPADGSYGQLSYSWLNPNVDRWRTPLVLNAVSSGKARVWAKGILFTPDPFYGWLWPYLLLAILLAAALLAWFRHRHENVSLVLSQQRNRRGGVAVVLWGLTLILPVTAGGWLVYQQQQSSQTYTAAELSHLAGRAVADPQAAGGQAWLVDPQFDPPQKAIYGPFQIFDAGRYRVAFRLKLPQAAATDQDLARLEVAATANFDRLITQALRAEHFSKPNIYHDFVLTVANPRRQALSFEVYYLGVAPLSVDRVTITRVAE